MAERSEDSSVHALLEVVRRDLEQRRHTALQAAQERADAIVRRARTMARQRVHRAAGEERARIREEVERKAATQALEARGRRQEAARSMLERAWDELPGALRRQWEDPESQRAWVEGLLAQARRVLPPVPWRIEHPEGWDPRAHADALEEVERATGDAPVFEAAAGLDAGLRIHAGDASLDGSVAGLLTDRRGVEGRLLDELLREGEP
ncbi:MAG: hypothetical protein ACOCV4_02165 [Myxococcota bacterium]